jgi:hypothetical protein
LPGGARFERYDERRVPWVLLAPQITLIVQL